MKSKPKRLCTKCNAEYSVCGFERHFKSCNGELNYWTKKSKGLLVIDNEITCRFCGKVCKNPNSQRNHSRLCKSNPDRQYTFLETNKEDPRIKNKKCQNQYAKAKELGLPKPQMSEKNKQSLREANRNITPEQRKQRAIKASETITKKMHNGEWHTFKDCPDYEYKGCILNGSWEFEYAKWLDLHNIKWERCKESFPYTLENRVHRYTPDFYLIETNEYIEIKGYKTKKDDAKWSQFPKEHTLKVLFKSDLIQLGINIK